MTDQCVFAAYHFASVNHGRRDGELAVVMRLQVGKKALLYDVCACPTASHNQRVLHAGFVVAVDNERRGSLDAEELARQVGVSGCAGHYP